MTAIEGGLGVAALLGAGVTAGVLFAVALSVLPALFAMETGTYVYAHQLLGRNWDPTMPVIVLSSTLADTVLAVVGEGAPRVLFAVAAVLLLGVSGVSHLCNVPINRRVKSVTDPGRLPGEAVVRVQACGVCHTDLHGQVQGRLRQDRPQVSSPHPVEKGSPLTAAGVTAW